MSSCYGYGGNVGNTQQQAPLWQAGPGAWDAAAGIKGDATAVVNLYRGKLLGQQAAGQRPQLCLPSQTMAAMAAPPPPMAIPAWLQRRKSTLPSAAMATAAHPAAPPFQPPHAPAPCPLRPCPPNSTGPGSLRVESFTAGTGGRLMRPGVGIGAGLMREARYSDLRFIHQIGEGGFGKVRGSFRSCLFCPNVCHSKWQLEADVPVSRGCLPFPPLMLAGLLWALAGGSRRHQGCGTSPWHLWGWRRGVCRHAGAIAGVPARGGIQAGVGCRQGHP